METTKLQSIKVDDGSATITVNGQTFFILINEDSFDVICKKHSDTICIQPIASGIVNISLKK